MKSLLKITFLAGIPTINVFVARLRATILITYYAYFRHILRTRKGALRSVIFLLRITSPSAQPTPLASKLPPPATLAHQLSLHHLILTPALSDLSLFSAHNQKGQVEKALHLCQQLRPRLSDNDDRWPQAHSLCVFLISGAGHTHAPPSCAETCFQALSNRFLTQGGAPAVGYSGAGFFEVELETKLEFVMARIGVL